MTTSPVTIKTKQAKFNENLKSCLKILENTFNLTFQENGKKMDRWWWNAACVQRMYDDNWSTPHLQLKAVRPLYAVQTAFSHYWNPFYGRSCGYRLVLRLILVLTLLRSKTRTCFWPDLKPVHTAATELNWTCGGDVNGPLDSYTHSVFCVYDTGSLVNE